MDWGVGSAASLWSLVGPGPLGLSVLGAALSVVLWSVSRRLSAPRPAFSRYRMYPRSLGKPSEQTRRVSRLTDGIGASSGRAWRRWTASEIATLVSTAAALIAVIFTGFTVQATREQVDLMRQGQLTDRYSKAVDLLGAADVERRIGGIYALERIARDSPSDQRTIVEVLTAFVRNHAPRVPGQECTATPPREVQAALTVLSRRSPLANDGSLDLSYSCLRGADFDAEPSYEAVDSGGYEYGRLDISPNLAGANFTGSDLSAQTLKLPTYGVRSSPALNSPARGWTRQLWTMPLVLPDHIVRFGE